MAASERRGQQSFADRQKQLLADQWSELLQTHKNARQEALSGQGDPRTKVRAMLYQCVKDFVRVAKPLLQPPGVDDLRTTRDWWTGVPIGEWEIADGRYTAQIESVRDWYHTEVPQTVEWTEQTETKLSGTEQRVRSVLVAPPMDISMSAAEVVYNGLADIGLGPDPTPNDDEHEFQYEHLAPGEEVSDG